MKQRKLDMFWDTDKDKTTESGNIRVCIHCGKHFDLDKSDGWRITQEQFTCNWCYMAGKRDSEDYDVW